MMSPEHKAYILRETLVALAINSVLSFVFSLLASHGRTSLPLWGVGGIALDFIPQLFMMTFATALAVTLLTRKRLRSGQVEPLDRRSPPLPRSAFLRAVLLGVVAVVVLAPPSIAVLALGGVVRSPGGAFVVAKVAYGALVSLLIAPPITLAALAGTSRIHSPLYGRPA